LPWSFWRRWNRCCRNAARTLILPMGVLFAAVSPQPAGAREEVSREVMETIEPAGKAAQDLGFVIMPIPLSNPTLGTGLTLPLLLLYNPDGKGRPWMTGVGGMYTDNGSWAVGAFQKAYLNNDKVRLTGAVGFADLNLKFYGIGSGAGKQGISIPIGQSGAFVMAEGLGQVANATFIGLRYRLLTIDTKLGGQEIPSLGITIPTVQLHSRSAMLGPVAQYDTRDNELNPRRGVYVNLEAGFARGAWGGESDYQKFNVAYNQYLPLAKGVLALRASACTARGSVPFYDLCLFGMKNDLRGYEIGQYRDKAMYAVQTEYRWPLFWRIGLVAFAGVGSVAKSFGSFTSDNLLPAAGVGVRLQASKKHDVNVSVDFAVSRDSKTLYFYIGEAF
jgi:outer membrane protein assembly factor BamA